MPDDFTSGTWQPVLADPRRPAADDVRRVVLTSGKLYYDLDKHREKNDLRDVAILRMEQLYPLPHEEVRAALEQYAGATDIVWTQEEPANQGPWPHVALNLPAHLDGERRLRRLSRAPSASPAAGSLHSHDAEQAKLLAEVFA
jgi:2-oxoglutarate dehydrogenase E1 component